MFSRLWNSYLAPLLTRPAHVQIAALCYRRGEDGLQVLLITSRSTRRWIIPKGWPAKGTDAVGTALEEAWEEAGVVRRDTQAKRIGRYRYKKIVDGGLPVTTDVHVYAVEVAGLADSFPEMGQRDRKWMNHGDAALVVGEPQLQAILKDLPALLEQVR